MKSIERICIFGDSTAWGAWDGELGGWVNRLWLYSAKNYDDRYREIYNLSISGGTTKTLLRRFESEATIRKADALIFQTGANDASYDKDIKKHVVDKDAFKKNIEEIIQKAKVITEHIVFIGTKNCDESKTTPVSWCNFCYANKDIEEYGNIIREVCKKEGVDYIHLFGLLNNDDFEDGIHPNISGHKKIYGVVQKYLVEKEWI